MFQVRIHGRGGQGVVSAAEMLSHAAFEEGQHSQAVPSFGSERMGAPVVAYVRINDKEIELREPVLDPHLLIVQDPTLFAAIDVFSGLRDDGYVLINTTKSLAELGIEEFTSQLPEGRVSTVAATELALKHRRRPTPNTRRSSSPSPSSDLQLVRSVSDTGPGSGIPWGTVVTRPFASG